MRPATLTVFSRAAAISLILSDWRCLPYTRFGSLCAAFADACADASADARADACADACADANRFDCCACAAACAAACADACADCSPHSAACRYSPSE